MCYFCVMKKAVAIFICLSVFALSWPVHAKTPVRQQPSGGAGFVDAVQLFSDGKYRKALSALSSLSSSEPENDAVWYYRGMAEAYLGMMDQSVEHLRKAVALDSTNYWYKQRLAAVYEAMGEDEYVVDMYESILRDHPRKTEVSYALLGLYMKQGNTGKALATLDDIEAVMGPGEQITSTRYDLLRREGRTDEALEALQKFNDRFSSPSILSMLGDYYLSEYDDTTAMRYYDEAISLQGGYVPAILGKSEVYRTTRRYRDYFNTVGEFIDNELVPASPKGMYLSNAIRGLDPNFIRLHSDDFDSLMVRCMKRHPADSTVLSTAGMYFLTTGRRNDGMALLEKSAGLYPGKVGQRANYIQALAYTEDWEKLRIESARAEEAFPKERAFQEFSAMASYNLGDYRAVIWNCEKRIKAHPADTSVTLPAWSTIADMHYSLGEHKEAFKAYEKALKINPDYAPVLNNYAYYLCLKGKKLKKALEMSRKTITSNPDNATYLDTYGWILHLLGRDAEAKPVFKRALLYGGKESAVMLEHYADVLDALGESDVAKVYRNQAKNRK